MRVLAVIAAVALASAPARADDPSSPMDGVADVAAACAVFHDGTDSDLACKPTGRVTLAGGAVAELYAIDDEGFARWMIVIDDHGAVARSWWLELERQDCGMHQCNLGQGRAPRLRAIRRGAAVAIELSAEYTHQFTNPDTGKSTTGATWRTYDVLVCGKNGSGDLACVARHRGAQGDSCTGTLASDGTVTMRCTATEDLGIE